MPISIVDKENCCGCAACSSICPKGCITMQYDEEGFQYPSVDMNPCVKCGLCEKVCPIINNPNTDIENNPTFFAARSTDESIRENSSSGAIAYLIAKKYLEDGAVVCGVRMTDDMSHAEHVCIENIQELYSLSGSKYIQSDTNGIFEKLNEYVKAERKILFVGTPCQVAAVKNYFRSKKCDIVYVDIICHGVPSQTLWDKYRSYIYKKYKGNIIRVNFRDKRCGWEKFGFSASFDNGKSIYEPRKRGFLGLFLANICLRPACASCKHKGIHRCSDITLGDFWGIERVLPEYDKKNGVSIAMVNTIKGYNLLNSLSEEIELLETDCGDLFTYRNKSLLRSVKISNRRDDFMIDLRRLPFNKLEKKYIKKDYMIRIKSIIKRLINK